MFFLRVVLLSLALVAVAVLPGQAQGVFDLGPLSGSIKKSGTVISEKPAPAASAKAKTADFSFRMSPALRRENQAKFVEGLRQMDPEAANLLEGVDLLGQIEPGLNEVGLRANDIADAYTMWLLSTYGLYKDIQEDATPLQIRNSRALVAATLAGSQEILSVSDADKQTLAEGLILQAILNEWISERLNEDPSLKPGFQAEFYRAAKEDMGVDLERFDWTANGLVAKSR